MNRNEYVLEILKREINVLLNTKEYLQQMELKWRVDEKKEHYFREKWARVLKEIEYLDFWIGEIEQTDRIYKLLKDQEVK